jgi:hypothetical protein
MTDKIRSGKSFLMTPTDKMLKKDEEEAPKMPLITTNN